MASVAQRRLTIGQERRSGFNLLGIGLLFAGLSVFQVVGDPSAVWCWIMACLGLAQALVGIIALRKARRDLAELEREHGVGAGSDGEIRRRHGL